MASSVMDGVGKAVIGVWRAHTVLDESEGAESSPEAPDRFRKLRSSSSLNSLRMSLRKRLPLRTVQTNSLPENPTWENMKEQPKTSTVRKLSRSARNSVSGVYQVGGLWCEVVACVFPPPSFFLVLWPSNSSGCRGPESFPGKNVWFRPRGGQTVWSTWVLAPQDVHLAQLPLPDAPLERAAHPGARRAPEDGLLLMQMYVGWRLGEAGGTWFDWRRYEAPMPLPTPRACESFCAAASSFFRCVDDLFSARSSFFF